MRKYQLPKGTVLTVILCILNSCCFLDCNNIIFKTETVFVSLL